jgi:hypothetical protein
MNNGKIMIECGREHLEGFRRFADLADVIVKWLLNILMMINLLNL